MALRTLQSRWSGQQNTAAKVEDLGFLPKLVFYLQCRQLQGKRHTKKPLTAYKKTVFPSLISKVEE